MDNPYPRLQNLRSTSQLLREATASFLSKLPTFLCLSLLIFSFRTILDAAATHLTSFVDGDPPPSITGTTTNRHHSRPSFPRFGIHLSRIATPDGGFFSDDDDGRSLLGAAGKPSLNSTFLTLGPMLGFSKLVVDNGIKVSPVVRSGITFNAEGVLFAEDEDEGEKGGSGKGQDMDKSVDFRFLGDGFLLGSMFLVIGLLSLVYMLVVLVFLLMHTLVFGFVFVAVVNDLLGSFLSLNMMFWVVSKLDLKSISGLIVLRWSVREVLTQLLALWYFGSIEGQLSFCKLAVMVRLMPLSVFPFWVGEEVPGFLFTWFLVDTFVGFVFSVDVWVAIAGLTRRRRRRRRREIVKDGCYFLSTMLIQAIQIKCLEALLCGSFFGWCLGRVYGRSSAKIFQSTMEVYFMVVWLMFFFVARREARPHNG